MSELLSKQEYTTANAEALDRYVGPYCGDIYLTALDLFSRLKYPREAYIFWMEEMDFISGGANADGEIGVWIGMQPGTINPSMCQRVNERFKLTEQQQLAEAYLPFILGHELGHAIQRDPAFAKYFGERLDDYVDPEEDYEAYVNSYDESNADYIAAVVVGNSQLGKLIGYMPPSESPSEWRNWAEQHSVPETIAMNKAS